MVIEVTLRSDAGKILCFTSSMQTRFALETIRITSEYAEATNGVILIHWPHEVKHEVKGDGKGEAVLISSQLIKAALNNDSGPFCLTSDGKRTEIKGREIAASENVPEGKFPETDVLWPRKKVPPILTLRLAPSALVPIVMAAEGADSLTLRIYALDKPIEFTFVLDSGAKVEGLIMPIAVPADMV